MSFLLGHLIKSYRLRTMSKIVAMFVSTFVPILRYVCYVRRVLPHGALEVN